MNYFKENKIEEIIQKASIKEKLKANNVFVKEKHLNVMAKFEIKFNKRAEELFSGRVRGHAKLQELAVEIFKEMLSEAKENGDWEIYGILFMLIGHNQIDPNQF